MLVGHNTNVTAGNTTFHVQTEDGGTARALIETTVHFRGRVLHRRTYNYFDLLPLDPARERALKLRLDEQHRAVIAEIRSGALNLALPRDDKAPPPAEAPEFAIVTGNDGRAQLQFDMPRLAGAEPALIIEAINGNSKGQLRFQLRAKPRVPSAS